MSTRKAPPAVPRRAAARLGQIVQQLRQERKESLREVAARAGLSPIHLSRIERHECSPTVEIVASLASALEVPVGLLFGEGHAPTHSPSEAPGAAPAAADTGAGIPTGRPDTAAAWLWPTVVAWERLHWKLNDPAVRLERRQRVAEAVARQLTAHRLALGQAAFYGALRQAWQSHQSLEARIGAARQLFARHQPQTPGAALIFPCFRCTFEYREDGQCDSRYAFSLVNIGTSPVLHFEHGTTLHGQTTSEQLGLHITTPDDRPAAEVEWLPESADVISWRARLSQPLQPGASRDLVERWTWRYTPPLAGIHNHDHAFEVHAFIGELELVVGYPPGYVIAFNAAWRHGGDDPSSMLEAESRSAERPLLAIRESLPPFDGSDRVTHYGFVHCLA
ncbi:MAG TPA: helix-turn-helix transcriptional regulator [Chloroflexota bacterium]|nr:helix-turn-helix transcriptional regulator [Chloroflexota bacterium]